MDTPISSLGICITCQHRSGCLSFQNGLRAQRPIWDCNEYEHNDAGADAVVSSSQAAGDHDPVDGIDRERKKGLCLNCDHRDSCLLPFSSGGVWHCEEYC